MDDGLTAKIKGGIITEYIEQYTSKCKEPPTWHQITLFSEGLMENLYYYHKRGFSIEDAVRKVMNDVSN